MLALLPPLAVRMRYGMVARGEACLERSSAMAIATTKNRVRRWLKAVIRERTR
ncbi:MAG: hypothetical protein ACOZAM_21760 [Pseudomonadota bacterium]